MKCAKLLVEKKKELKEKEQREKVIILSFLITLPHSLFSDIFFSFTYVGACQGGTVVASEA